MLRKFGILVIGIFLLVFTSSCIPSFQESKDQKTAQAFIQSFIDRDVPKMWDLMGPELRANNMDDPEYLAFVVESWDARGVSQKEPIYHGRRLYNGVNVFVYTLVQNENGTDALLVYAIGIKDGHVIFVR